ncbi:hypothetical protein HY991_04335, partial [Candidatus Micrarchaeota archaeon]|nr:hypothetical protein [Candidatus Micrarchaeota archaeon]
MIVMKSQVSAPIELLVAVIVLAASFGIVFLAIRSEWEQKCMSELKVNTVELRNIVEDGAVSSSSIPKEKEFFMRRCGVIVSGLRFVYYSNAAFCKACQKAGGCWKIEPVYKYGEGAYQPISEAIVCLDNLSPPPGISFEAEAPSPASTCLPMLDTPCPSPDASGLCKGIASSVWKAGAANSVWLSFFSSPGKDRYKISFTKKPKAGEE